jgi:hypothetical protein
LPKLPVKFKMNSVPSLDLSISPSIVYHLLSGGCLIS